MRESLYFYVFVWAIFIWATQDKLIYSYIPMNMIILFFGIVNSLVALVITLMINRQLDNHMNKGKHYNQQICGLHICTNMLDL